MVGCALARQLNERLPALSVHLIEARDAPTAHPMPAREIPHPRSYALSPQSLEFLGLLDNPEMAEQVKLGPYASMQIWEAHNPATMKFHTDDLPFDETKPHHPKLLGAVVEDIPLVRALWEPLELNPKNTLTTSSTLEKLQMPTANPDGLVTYKTSQNTCHQTRLLVAADGAQSPIRKELGVQQMQWEYGRHALTFTVELEEEDSLPRTAYQKFVHGAGKGMGPLALLPTHSPRHAIVVWSTTPELVEKWKMTDDNDALVEHLNSLLQQGPQRLPPLVERTSSGGSTPPLINNILFGVERVLDTVQDAGAMMSANSSRAWMAPPLISQLVSPKLSFPLACRNVPHYHAAKRVVLIGDAAHTVHPMAGQGLNLGLASVQSLVQSLVKMEAVGMDVTTNNLEAEMRKRHAANTSAILGIHTLHELFKADDVPIMHAKSFGMNVLQQVGPLRRKLVQAATQGVLF